MSTIPIEISTEQLLRAVERLPANELETFVAQVIALRTRRAGGQLDANETALLLIINAAHLDPAQQARFDALVAKRQAETITPTELQELIAMTDVIEQRDTERLEALQELARVRQTTVGILMDALGIRTPAYG
ncbi:hypothetical protein EYB53_020825 [Candidatus Chloroploca sp. M-50]|uniref:STAS/SEC14 domain-containing protein n=1 Tax=Candidatus Chloroploca mongolica TaxID=2528176 RepID=A0ABS4DFE7_9CHLR|nr:STAS/SEC14 domain-containing protein [Candidatus Chloroploca mongolica]MBP1468168.1 hypothetical protein [Candidatus Chloroploca mongolica]